MFKIAIPSRSRPYSQRTISNLSEDLWPNVVLVVPGEQYTVYRAAIPEAIEVLPWNGTGIGLKRQFILRMESSGKLIMMDDDLTFYKRIEDGTKFIRMNRAESEGMVTQLLDFLDRYVMVGMVDKFMSQTRPRSHVECTRFNQVLGFNRDMFPHPWPRFRLPHDEEHDIHLQLLTQGIKTAVTTEYSKVDNRNASGGCNEWRSPEVFQQTYEMLQTYWPTIVTVQSATKVRYNWKEAKRMGGLL